VPRFTLYALAILSALSSSIAAHASGGRGDIDALRDEAPAPAAPAASSPDPTAPQPPPGLAPTLVPAEACLPPAPEDAEDGDAAAHADEEGEGDDVEDADFSPADDGLRYTKDISDDELRRRWRDDPATLGSMSVGLTNAGRLINGVPFPKGPYWTIVDAAETWATQETVDFLTAAITEVNTRIPGTPPIRINDISKKDGGWIRPHRSHQNGRDVDLGFYYPDGKPVIVKKRETCIDVARNWALVRAIVTTGDVQVILLDKRVQAVLRSYAENIGEDEAWLASLFDGPDSILKHARGHRDHFHVRYFNGRAQELGRRIQPLLAERPENNLVHHKVRRGDTLGTLARRYGSSTKVIQRSNGLKAGRLRVGQVLTIPLRGPCTTCPLPPPVIVPPRRLPPIDDPSAMSPATTDELLDLTQRPVADALASFAGGAGWANAWRCRS
jgi:nucleoid-associated protein YgaU